MQVLPRVGTHEDSALSLQGKGLGDMRSVGNLLWARTFSQMLMRNGKNELRGHRKDPHITEFSSWEFGY